MSEGVVRSAVERRAADDVIAGFGEIENRIHDRGLSARDGERGRTAFERRNALLEDVGRRIIDARVDIAELLESEEFPGVLRGVEEIRGRLIDWNGARLGRGVAVVATVNCERVK